MSGSSRKQMQHRDVNNSNTTLPEICCWYSQAVVDFRRQLERANAEEEQAAAEALQQVQAERQRDQDTHFHLHLQAQEIKVKTAHGIVVYNLLHYALAPVPYSVDHLTC